MMVFSVVMMRLYRLIVHVRVRYDLRVTHEMSVKRILVVV